MPHGFENPHSYRGFYDQLAFEPLDNVEIGAMLTAARAALGSTYTGWKGGEYTMNAYTECHIAERGSMGIEISAALLDAWLVIAKASSGFDDDPAPHPDPRARGLREVYDDREPVGLDDFDRESLRAPRDIVEARVGWAWTAAGEALHCGVALAGVGDFTDARVELTRILLAELRTDDECGPPAGGGRCR